MHLTTRLYLSLLMVLFLLGGAHQGHGQRIGKTDADGGYGLVAGTGQSQGAVRYEADQPAGSATRIPLGNPFGVEVTKSSIYLTTVDDHCIWELDADAKRIARVAGNGLQGYSGDGGPAAAATFNWPHEVRVDREGNLYIADTRNHVIRRIDSGTGIVSTLAGSGAPGFAGDGGSGSDVQFKQPHSVVLDGRGGLLVADTQNHRIRRIDLETGVVQTISGSGTARMPRDGQPAAEADLHGPRSLAVDDESIWIALREGNSVWRIDRDSNTIHHVAGTGRKGYEGDGGPAKSATFNGPKGIVLDEQNGVLVVDTENHAVRRIDLDSAMITTVLGGNRSATTTTLNRPHGIAVWDGRVFLVADSENHRVLWAK